MSQISEDVSTAAFSIIKVAFHFLVANTTIALKNS